MSRRRRRRHRRHRRHPHLISLSDVFFLKPAKITTRGGLGAWAGQFSPCVLFRHRAGGARGGALGRG